MNLTELEIVFLKYYLEKYNAKWIRVFKNKHAILDTVIILYSGYKRKLKYQPKTGQLTFTNMFKSLNEGDWYYIPDVLLSLGGREVVQTENKKE